MSKWKFSLLSFYTTLFGLMLNGCQTRQIQTEVAESDQRPNIVIIMADDMGFSDVGFMGSEIVTPHLDQLASDGLLMTQFYNTGRCAPTRATLLTGLYNHQVGMGHMTRDDGLPSYRGHLSQNCATIAELLQASGYGTYVTGKWHLGEKQFESWPLQRGFDRFYGHQEGWGIYFYPFIKDFIKVYEGNEPTEIDTANFYYTRDLTTKAIQYLDEHPKEHPFFLYVSHSAPHSPLQAPEDMIQRYRGKYKDGFEAIRQQRLDRMKTLGIFSDSMELSPANPQMEDWDALSLDQQDEYDLRMAIYAAQLDIMDQEVGRLLQKIKDMGAFENTVIFFFSDNGGANFFGKPEPGYDAPLGGKKNGDSYSPSWANVSNTPFRMFKKWAHEGGIATPLVIHYPSMTGQRFNKDDVGHVLDLMPTCLELAEVSYPQTWKGNHLPPLEGRSLVPLLKGESRETVPYLFWDHEGHQAVRKNDWKLVKEFGETNWNLYNMHYDRLEMHDQAPSYPHLVAEMDSAFTAWGQRVGLVPWDKLLEHRRKEANL